MSVFKSWIFWLAMGLFVYLAPIVTAQEPTDFAPTPTDRWCYAPEVYDRIIAAFVESGPTVANKIVVQAAETGLCERVPHPMYVMFTGQQIVRRYKKGLEGPELVIEGYLGPEPGGRKVYIWLDTKDLENFLVKGQQV